jgi:hypothetical protein
MIVQLMDWHYIRKRAKKQKKEDAQLVVVVVVVEKELPFLDADRK